jgi:hypothetical protein
MSSSYDVETGRLAITFREFGDRYFKQFVALLAGGVLYSFALPLAQ